jgi:hypothetical protein
LSFKKGGTEMDGRHIGGRNYKAAVVGKFHKVK